MTRQCERPEHNAAHNMSVGLVYYNEVDKIECCLQALLSSENIIYLKEIIVLFNARPTDLAWGIFQKYQALFPAVNFCYLPYSSNNIGRGRRRVVNRASGQYLCFTDPDCQVSNHWLGDLLAEFKTISANDNSCAAIVGKTIVSDKGLTGLQKLLTNKWFSFKSPQTWQVSKPQKIDHAQTSNSLFLRDKIKQVGNFSPAYKMSGEDLELGLRLVTNGFSIYLCARPLVLHHVSQPWLRGGLRFFKLGQGQYNPYLGQRYIHKAFIVLAFFVFLVFYNYWFLALATFVCALVVFYCKFFGVYINAKPIIKYSLSGLFYSLGLVKSYIRFAAK